MIKKLLDKYFLDKLKQQIKYFLLPYRVDIKIEETKKYIEVYIKDMRYNDDMYEKFAIFYKDTAFEYLMDWNILEEGLKEKIINYDKKRK